MIFDWLLSLCNGKDDDFYMSFVFGIIFGAGVGLATGLIQLTSEASYFNLILFSFVGGFFCSIIFILFPGSPAGIFSSMISSYFMCSLSLVHMTNLSMGWLQVVVLVLVLLELLFYFDTQKKKAKADWLWFTLWVKFKCLVEALFILLTLNNIRFALQTISISWSVVLKWLGYIGMGVTVLAIAGLILYGWLWINGAKYRGGNK